MHVPPLHGASLETTRARRMQRFSRPHARGSQLHLRLPNGSNPGGQITVRIRTRHELRGRKLRRCEHTHSWYRSIPSLDLNERSERARALRQWRSADVKREHIGIAVTLGLAARGWRIEPCAGG